MIGRHLNLCEDSLTASVFTHLLHLPVEMFWRLISAACYTENLPVNVGEPLAVEGWPSWDGTNTGNANRVEPDLFIRFEAFDLIIEAKRWDADQQNPEQWRRELIAYANTYGEERKPVRMIALGGLRTRDDQTIRHRWSSLTQEDGGSVAAASHDFVCPVHMCRWEGLLRQCKSMRRQFEALTHPSSQTSAHMRTLDHLIEIFGVHGFSTGAWFADFDFAAHRLAWSGKEPGPFAFGSKHVPKS